MHLQAHYSAYFIHPPLCYYISISYNLYLVLCVNSCYDLSLIFVITSENCSLSTLLVSFWNLEVVILSLIFFLFQHWQIQSWYHLLITASHYWYNFSCPLLDFLYQNCIFLQLGRPNLRCILSILGVMYAIGIILRISASTLLNVIIVLSNRYNNNRCSGSRLGIVSTTRSLSHKNSCRLFTANYSHIQAFFVCIPSLLLCIWSNRIPPTTYLTSFGTWLNLFPGWCNPGHSIFLSQF